MTSTNGFHRTTADEQYARGQAAGTSTLVNDDLSADAIAVCVRFDRAQQAANEAEGRTAAAAFHCGRADVMEAAL